jgi:hypothetical protein
MTKSPKGPVVRIVNSSRESERLFGYFGEIGELLPWFAAPALA